MNKVFLAVDGDDVGNYIEYHILRNEIEELHKFSARYNTAIEWMQDELVRRYGAIIALSGGDTILAMIYCGEGVLNLHEIEDMRAIFAAKAGGTISVGIGETPREAHIALKYAKVSGKNMLCQFKDVHNG